MINDSSIAFENYCSHYKFIQFQDFIFKIKCVVLTRIN
jgi:hypothetical protein